MLAGLGGLAEPVEPVAQDQAARLANGEAAQLMAMAGALAGLAVFLAPDLCQIHQRMVLLESQVLQVPLEIQLELEIAELQVTQVLLVMQALAQLLAEPAVLLLTPGQAKLVRLETQEILEPQETQALAQLLAEPAVLPLTLGQANPA